MKLAPLAPQVIADALAQHLAMDAETADAIAKSYVGRNLWDANGGMTRESVEYSVDFFTSAGSLSEGLAAEDVADLSYLEDVLGEIGRQ